MVVSGEASWEKHQPPCSAQATQNLDPCIMEDALPGTLSDSCWAAFGGTIPFTQPAFCTTPGVYVQLTPLMGESHGGWEGPKGVAQGHTQVWPCLVQ